MKKKEPSTVSARSSDNDRVTRAAGVVGLATLFSRILGYVRDMVIAHIFGAGMVSDAFIVAFRIPNMLRRLFGEGSLSMAFVPVFTDTLNHQGLNEAEKLAVGSLRCLLLVLVLVSAVAVVAAPVLVHMLAYGFTDDPEKYALCVKLTRIMVPYAIFIGMVALCMGILNVLGHFAAPALAPLLLNAGMIGMVLVFSWMSPSMGTRSVGLALGVLIGGGLQLGLQLPFMIRKGIRLWRRVPLWHPAMGQVLVLLGPTLFGAGVYQVNTLVISLLGSLLPQGSVSYLYYADRLVQFPLGVFAIAMATAVLPTLSHQASLGQVDALRQTFAHAVQLVFFITVPCMVGLIVLREPIVALLFQRGAFDTESTRLTASALMYYGIGLWAFSAVRIFISTFYAMKDTRTPVKMAAVAIAANMLLGVLLMRSMAHNGLALALSVSSMLHLGLMTLALRKKIGGIPWRMILSSLVRSGCAAASMGVVVWQVADRLLDMENVTVSGLSSGLFICIASGIAVFSAIALLFRAPEIQSVKKMWVKKAGSS